MTRRDWTKKKSKMRMSLLSKYLWIFIKTTSYAHYCDFVWRRTHLSIRLNCHRWTWKCVARAHHFLYCAFYLLNSDGHSHSFCSGWRPFHTHISDSYRVRASTTFRLIVSAAFHLGKSMENTQESFWASSRCVHMHAPNSTRVGTEWLVKHDSHLISHVGDIGN